MNFRLRSKIYAQFPTQSDFAKAVKIHESRLSRIVRGRENPTIDEVRRISEVLQTEPGRLFSHE